MAAHPGSRGSRPGDVERCPECGRRVVRACPLHGTLDGPCSDSEVFSSVVAPGWIPGYRVQSLLAFGGFGVVFAASPEGGGRQVAVKLAREDRPQACSRLLRERRALVDIGPPHVPDVLASGETTSKVPYLVMEHLGDATLAARLVDAEPMPVWEAVGVTIAILRALAAVHARGYVHCDLKPENVFVRAGGATLIDFGHAAGPLAPGHASRAALPGSGASEPRGGGTAEYMAPEQCEGQGDIDARADVYAMGVMLHEMIAGRPPFWGPRARVREMHTSHRPPRLSAAAPSRVIPPMLETIVACCLAKDRRERFGSACDLMRALEATLAAGDAPPVPPTQAKEGPRASSERLTGGVVYFAADEDPIAVQARLRALGGQLVHGAGGRYAAVFGQNVAENPAHRALLAAEELVRNGLCARARVDVAQVVVQTRRDGTRRYLSPTLARAALYPAPGDAPVSITPAAAAVLPPEPDAPASRGGRSSRASWPEGRSSVPGSERDGGAAVEEPHPLLGRDEILASLLASARETARDGIPTVVTVTGEPGVGKSHLFRELAEGLAPVAPGATLIALRVQEPALGDVDRTLADILEQGMASRAASRGEGAEPAAIELPPVLAMALRRSSAAPPVPSGEPVIRSLGAAPGALRSAITVAAGEALRAMAADGPLFVLLDDAHFAGDVALAALEFATLSEADAPIWVCAICRPALLQDRPAWGERAGRRERRAIGPLDRTSAEALCRRLLLPVETVPGRVVELLVERAQATPLLLVELVRGLHREGIVRPSPRGSAWYVATDELDRLPDLPLVEWLAHREIEGLEPALRGHARLVALLGDQVTEAEIEGVVRLLDENGAAVDLPLDAKVGTRRLLSAGVIVKDAEGRCGYRQALVRQALANGAPERFARGVHVAAVRYYRSADTIGDERRLSRLATHASAAGLAEEAARAFFVLAERARAWHAYLEAEGLYSRVLEQPGLAASDRAAAHRGRGLMRERLSRYHDALADLVAARATAEEEGDVPGVVDLLLDEALVLDWMDEFAASEARVREAEARLPPGGPLILRARLLLGLGRSAMRFSRNDEAARLLERAVDAAEVLGHDGYETLVISLLLLSYLWPALGREGAARVGLEWLVDLCESHGDRLHLAGALNARALLHACAGEKERMVDDMRQSLAIARELGQGSLELAGEFNLGELLLLMDDAAAAAPHVARALALDLRISGPEGGGVVALLEARLRLYTDDMESAAAIVGLIRARQAEARTRGEPDPLPAPSADVLCEAIELAVGGGTPAQWDELESRSERFSFGQERIEVIEARAAAAEHLGQREEARRHLGRARELARKIPNAMGARLARRLGDLDGESN